MKKQFSFLKSGSVSLSIVLAIGAFLFYTPSLSYEYVLDDAIVIAENSFTQNGWAGIPDIWAYDTFRGFFGEEGKAQLVEGGRYRPMSLTFFAIEGSLFGFSPFVGHLFNIFWYAVLAALIYLCLYSFLRKHKFQKEIALAVTLMFIVHPVHSEVVANIKGRDEIFAMLGAVGALWVSLRHQSIRSWVLAFAFMMFGIFSKEHVAVMVVLIPLSLYYQRVPKWWFSALPPLAAVGFYLVVRQQVIGGLFSGETPMELMNNPFMRWNGSGYDVLGFWERWPTVFSVLPEYLRLLLWPYPLTHDYYPHTFEVLAGWNPKAVMSILLFTGLSVWAIVQLPKRKIWSWGWLWFLIALFPMSNILLNVGTFCSERFLFLPSLGGLMILCVLIFQWIPNRPAWILTALFSLTYVLLLQQRLPDWQSNFSLFTHDVEVSALSAKANNSAGGAYNDRAGAALTEEEQVSWARKSKPHLEEAARLHPTYKNAYLQLGNSFFYLKEYEQAIRQYEYCLELDPDYKDGLKNLFLAYRQAGKYMGEQKNDLTAAIQYLDKAYRLRPTDYETLRLLGVAHGLSKNSSQAISFFKKALERRPNDAQAYYNLGASYLQVGKVDSGQLYLEEARLLDPSIFQ